VNGTRPVARDGHTGVVIGFNLFIFGGDRHHNPFNDLYILDLLSILEEKNIFDLDELIEESDDNN